MLTPEQCRAARAWLEWSQADLAQRAKVGVSTVRDFEAGRRTPIQNNINGMAKALADGGVMPAFDASGKATGIVVSDDARAASASSAAGSGTPSGSDGAG